jgi:hypothetical protein
MNASLLRFRSLEPCEYVASSVFPGACILDVLRSPDQDMDAIYHLQEGPSLGTIYMCYYHKLLPDFTGPRTTRSALGIARSTQSQCRRTLSFPAYLEEIQGSPMKGTCDPYHHLVSKKRHREHWKPTHPKVPDRESHIYQPKYSICPSGWLGRTTNPRSGDQLRGLVH